MEQNDYYGILGVDKASSQKQIKDAYRKLALVYHPDKNRDISASARMKEINEAYAVLSDPQKRKQYDTLREQYGSAAYGQFRQSYTDHDIFRGSDVRQVYEEMSRIFGFRSFDDIFNEVYGANYRSFEFRRPGMFGRGFVFQFPPRRARRPGAHTHHQMTGPLGKLFKYALKKQWGVELPERGKDLTDRITVSPEFAASGGRIQYLCRLKSREFVITIPPGLRDGQRIRLRGIGEQGKGGGESGDLYITVRVRKTLLLKIKAVLRALLSRLLRFL